MKRQIILQGGILVEGNATRREDLLIEDEKIAPMNSLIAEDAEIIDVSGKYIFPGFIDAHTHFDLSFGEYKTADDFETGTKAAIVGGTTCIVDFATQYKGETLKQALMNWHAKAEKQSSCDYAFHLAISDWNEKVAAELDQIIKEGVSSFKLYMTYDDMMVNDQQIYEVLTRLKELGGIACVHCENDGIIKARIQQEKAVGHMGPEVHPRVRPQEVEGEAIHRLLTIAGLVDTPIIIVHLSSKVGLEEVRRARKRGQTVYIETCPQYVILDESKYQLEPEESRTYVCSPPLRKVINQEELWKALNQDEIQLISTDHCSFTKEQKDMGKEDFTKIPNGLPGVEHRPVLMYTQGVEKGNISLIQFCRMLSEGPAKLYGLYPKKGSLQPGSDADLVIWNPTVKWTITAKEQSSKACYTPFEGIEVIGKPEMVYLHGELVVKDGKLRRGKTGIYQKRKKKEEMV